MLRQGAAGLKHPIGPLQQDVRSAAERIRSLRGAVAIGFFLGGIPLALIVRWVWHAASIPLAMSISAVVTAGIFALAPALAALYRRRRAAVLRRALESLTREEVSAILFPLLEEKDPDTQELAATMIRSLRIGGREPSPGTAPEGTGREVSSD